ncbi:glycosyltransferase [candidate division KSB1 bacterium]|nr:glycosyltransferase [candidate division KSB1 bacterium]
MTKPTSRKDYLVSALVPTYGAGRFMRGLLEDLEAQTIADRLQIIIVDTASPTNEGEIVRKFQQRYNNILYVRTETKENSHAATIRAMKMAIGKYVTLACTDDRHKSDAYERMVAVLEARPDVALVYANVHVTVHENETFDNFTNAGKYQWFDYDPWKLLHCCFMGPQPMWRREMHVKYGYFDGKLESAGDWEFWLRMAEQETFLHIDEFLGLYLFSPTSSGNKNPQLAQKEAGDVHTKYIHREPALRKSHIRALHLLLNDDPDSIPLSLQNITVDLHKTEPTPMHKHWLVDVLHNDESLTELESAVKFINLWLKPSTDVGLKVVYPDDHVNHIHPDVHIAPKTQTLSRAVQQGIRFQTDGIVFVTPKVRFSAELVQMIYDTLAIHPNCAAIAPADGDELSWMFFSTANLRQLKRQLPDRLNSINDVFNWVNQLEEIQITQQDELQLLLHQVDAVMDDIAPNPSDAMLEDALILSLLAGQTTSAMIPDILDMIRRWVNQHRWVEAEVALNRVLLIQPENRDAHALHDHILLVTGRSKAPKLVVHAESKAKSQG